MTEEESIFDQVFGGPDDESLEFEGANIPTEDYVPPAPEPHRVYGSKDPKMPLWKDRVHNAGRPKTVRWESSVLKYIKDVAKEMGWANVSLCKEIANTLRLLTGNYESVAQVISKWDSYPEKEQKKTFSIDRAVDDCDVDRDEFAGLVLAAVQKHIQRQGAAIIDRNWNAIIQAAVDHAIRGGAAGAKERIELIRILDRMAAREREGLSVVPKTTRASKAEESGGNGAGKSLDSQSAELDDIDNLGVD